MVFPVQRTPELQGNLARRVIGPVCLRRACPTGLLLSGHFQQGGDIQPRLRPNVRWTKPYHTAKTRAMATRTL